MPLPPFAQKRETLHESIRTGRIGCGFAMEAARQDRILYAPALDEDAIATALQDFVRQETKRVLILLPDSDPRTWEEGRDMAWKIYSNLLRAIAGTMPTPTRAWDPDAVRHATEQGEYASALLNREVPSAWMETILAEPLYQQYIGEYTSMDHYFHLDPAVIHPSRGEKTLFTFAMGPYYRPMRQGRAHVRSADHLCVLINYRDDLEKVMRDRHEEVAAIQRWALRAMGELFIQAFHVPQEPHHQHEKPPEVFRQWAADMGHQIYLAQESLGSPRSFSTFGEPCVRRKPTP